MAGILRGPVLSDPGGTPWRRWALLAACLLGAARGVLAAPAIAVVADPALRLGTVDQRTLARIFLRRQRVDQAGHAVVPVNLPPAHPLRGAFSALVLGRRPEALARYWDEQYFHGITPPAVLGSQESVLRFVTRTPGAIGYVADCRVDGSVRVLERLELPATLAAGYPALCAGQPPTASTHRPCKPCSKPCNDCARARARGEEQKASD